MELCQSFLVGCGPSDGAPHSENCQRQNKPQQTANQHVLTHEGRLSRGKGQGGASPSRPCPYPPRNHTKRKRNLSSSRSSFEPEAKHKSPACQTHRRLRKNGGRPICYRYIVLCNLRNRVQSGNSKSPGPRGTTGTVFQRRDLFTNTARHSQHATCSWSPGLQCLNFWLVHNS